MTTRPNKTKGAPKPKKPTRLGHLNELDPDAMTLGDWQRFRGYDPKTRAYVTQRRQAGHSGVGGMGEMRQEPMPEYPCPACGRGVLRFQELPIPDGAVAVCEPWNTRKPQQECGSRFRWNADEERDWGLWPLPAEEPNP